VSGGSGDADHHVLSVVSPYPVNGFWVWVNASRGDFEDDDESDLSSLSFEILTKDIKPTRRAQARYIERAGGIWQMKFTTRGSCWRMSKTGFKEGCDRLSRREERAEAHGDDPASFGPKISGRVVVDQAPTSSCAPRMPRGPAHNSRAEGYVYRQGSIPRLDKLKEWSSVVSPSTLSRCHSSSDGFMPSLPVHWVGAEHRQPAKFHFGRSFGP
jgi:hypothetical protein